MAHTAKGTTFTRLDLHGTDKKKHSADDWGLTQQHVDFGPAKPKLNYIDVPGADGSLDLTEALGVGVVYEDRELTWTFAVGADDNWTTVYRTVANFLNGKKCKIVLDDYSGYYLVGRVYCETYASDRLLRQITVKARCQPFIYRPSTHTYEYEDFNYDEITGYELDTMISYETIMPTVVTVSIDIPPEIAAQVDIPATNIRVAVIPPGASGTTRYYTLTLPTKKARASLDLDLDPLPPTSGAAQYNLMVQIPERLVDDCSGEFTFTAEAPGAVL